MRIGFLEFYFDIGEPLRVELILGKNIRDWSYKHPHFVGVLTDMAAEQVWRDVKDEASMDMLQIDFTEPRVIKHCQVCAQYENLSHMYQGKVFPSIRLTGLTYRLAEPVAR